MITPDFERKLFEKEFAILEKALAEPIDDSIDSQALLAKYSHLLDQYDKLLTITRKVVKVSDIQGNILIKREQEFRSLLDSIHQGVLTFGQDLLVKKEYSAECKRIFGSKISRQPFLSLLSVDDAVEAAALAATLQQVWSLEDTVEQQALLDHLPHLFTCRGRWLQVDFRMVARGDEEKAVLAIIADITAERKANQEIAYLGAHDRLTGLHNRAYLELRLEELSTADNYPLSIIMADMNGLKLTNDVFGHAEGDRLLTSLADVLRANLQHRGVASRWGGDEFVILLQRTDAQACQSICEAIRQDCRDVQGLPIDLSAALGAATATQPGQNILELLSLVEQRMYTDKLQTGRQFRQKVVADVEQTLESQCFESPGHKERLEQLGRRLAAQVGLGTDALAAQIALLASVHDIGKVAIAREILGKPGPLNEAEWEIMRHHSEIGYRMVQSLGELSMAESVLAFHEWWNGQGYPSGLIGTQIPLLTRLLSIVDVYDVLTHDRPYRAAMTPEAALGEIERSAGTQFDPELAKVFLELMRSSKPA